MKTGSQLKQEGQDLVASHDQEWSDYALSMLREFIAETRKKNYGEFFNMVVFKQWLRYKGAREPKHHNCYGSFPRRAASAGLIEITDRYVSSPDPKAHARKVPLWRIL